MLEVKLKHMLEALLKEMLEAYHPDMLDAYQNNRLESIGRILWRPTRHFNFPCKNRNNYNSVLAKCLRSI
jgi:hypothetical protein